VLSYRPAVQRTKFNGMLVNKNLVNCTVLEIVYHGNDSRYRFIRRMRY